MYVLNLSNLQAGDIVLMKRANRRSELIRKVTGSDFSHAMLYVDGISCIDSDGPGVHAKNPMRLLFEKEEDVLVLRAKEISEEQIGNIITFARSKIATQYSREEARKVVSGDRTDVKENRQFCTRFVAQSYEYGGVSVSNEPDFCSPKEIEDCDRLQTVGNVLQIATDSQIQYAREENSPIDLLKQIQNQIFELTRKLTNEDIQTFTQVDEYLLAHPEIDEEMTKILAESGYLEFWKIDFIKNPWQYDYEEFKAIHERSEFQQGSDWIRNMAESLQNRFCPVYHYYKDLYRKTHLQYFKKMMELYNKLLKLNRMRKTVSLRAKFEYALHT